MKNYTVKAHVGNSTQTLGMDGNWYPFFTAVSEVKPASFRTKMEASEFYFRSVKQIKASSAFIEGPKGGYHHIVQYRDKVA